MKVYTEEITIKTSKDIELVNITERVHAIVGKSGILEGMCCAYSQHTTTAIIINENEVGLLKDIVAKISRDFPKHAGWEHDRHDNNAHSHLAATYIGSSRMLPVVHGKIALGTWQSVFFVELDGPRARSVIVQIMGKGKET